MCLSDGYQIYPDISYIIYICRITLYYTAFSTKSGPVTPRTVGSWAFWVHPIPSQIHNVQNTAAWSVTHLKASEDFSLSK